MIKKITQKLDLGTLSSEPKQLTGEFMHQMYALFTTKGKYAIKLLNPYIMKREAAMGNFQAAEQLKKLVEESRIPILPAMTFNGQKMQEIEEQFFYIYEWYEGRSLKMEEINPTHCRKIGKALAKIHQIDRKEVPFESHDIQINWDDYIEKMADYDKGIYEILNENRSLLYESQRRGNQAIKKITPLLTIFHNDMDSKNVLWHGFDYRIMRS